MALSDLTVRINADTKGFQRGLTQAESGLTKMKSGLSSMIKTGFGIAGVTSAVVGLTQAMKGYLGLESSMLRVSSIFGNSAKNIQAFAEGSAKSFGLAETAAYEFAAVYGNLFRNITASTEENSAVTIEMLKASAVVASKTGRTMTDVMERIRSGLLGNTESIEDLGIQVNVAMLEMTDAFRRIANGRSWEQLNFYEQQQIRTLGILEQAHKNFGTEVQKGSAFAVSVLAGSLKDFAATAGIFVNAGLQPIISALTQIVQAATAALKALAGLLGLNISVDASGTADAYAGAADSSEEMAGGLEDSAKAAKKLKGQLASFDKFNDITPQTEKGSGKNVAGGLGGIGGLGIVTEFEKLNKQDSPWLETFEKLAKLLDPVKKSLQLLGDEMERLGGFAWEGLKDFYNSFLVPVGRWVFGEGLPRFIDAMTNGLALIDWQKINDALHSLWEALTPFAINVGEGLLWLWEQVLVPLGTWTMNEVVPRFLGLLAKALDGVNAIINAVKPGFQYLFENVLKPIAQWTGGRIIEIMDLIGETFVKISGWFKDHSEEINKAIQSVGDLISAVWENLIKPVLDSLWDTFKFVFTAIGPLVGAAAEALMKWLTDICTFLTGVFTADWEKAWEGIKGILTGVWNGIVSVIEVGINLVIKGINWLVEQANSLIEDINFVLPVSIPLIPTMKSVKLPRLAKGGMVFGEVNAVVGDNFNARQDPEVISPLSKLQDMITSAILQRDIAGGGGEITLKLVMEDGTALAEALIDPMNKTAKNQGYAPVFRVAPV